MPLCLDMSKMLREQNTGIIVLPLSMFDTMITGPSHPDFPNPSCMILHFVVIKIKVAGR